MNALSVYNVSESEGWMEIVIPAKRYWSIYLFAPFTLAFGGFVTFKFISEFVQKDVHPIILVVATLFLSPFLFILLNSFIGMCWVTFGKERIVITPQGVASYKTIIVPYSSRHYTKNEITEIYIKQVPYVSIGRNDFMSTFRAGTIHFKKGNKQVSIAGGLSEEEGLELLQKMQDLWAS